MSACYDNIDSYVLFINACSTLAPGYVLYN